MHTCPANIPGPDCAQRGPGSFDHLEAAFTRVDALALLGVLGLLALIALPALANSKPHSQRAVCANNLRLIGQAFQMWADGHNDRYPCFVSGAEGGLGQDPVTGAFRPGVGNSWFQYWWLSNELHTPKILACPSDTKRVASSFSTAPTGGLLNPIYQNNAVSYFLTHPMPEKAEQVLSGDRNWSVGPLSSGGCNYFPSGYRVLAFPRQTPLAWTNSIHIESGNILFNGGEVEQLSSAGFQRVSSRFFNINGSACVMMPE